MPMLESPRRGAVRHRSAENEMVVMRRSRHQTEDFPEISRSVVPAVHYDKASRNGRRPVHFANDRRGWRRIWVETIPGGGTIFHLRALPRERSVIS